MGLCETPLARTSDGGSPADGDSTVPKALVRKRGRPSQCDPTGTGLIVNDILTPWGFPECDPFILLHEFGPLNSNKVNIPVGMHPHRGFNEVPYLKQGCWIATDAWKPEGDPKQPMRSGCVQWGFIGCGIEHGAKFDSSYAGPLHGFQLWINLPGNKKMDPPQFQDAESDALPVVNLSDLAKAKVLVGELQGMVSPIDTGVNQVQYVDVMLQPGAEIPYTIPDGFLTVFVYVYAGQGRVCSEPVSRGDVLNIEANAALDLQADSSTELSLLVLSGVPLKENIVQYGPFVMSSRAQIQQAFHEYQSGKFLHETCEYLLHTAEGTERSQRSLH